MDTLAERWDRLKPTLAVRRPDGAGPFPVVLIFPGCGGVREHLHRYADAAVDAGWMAVTVESFLARGWSDAFVRTFVCTGLLLRGGTRAGDVMAAATGVKSLPDVDPGRIVLAGWSHGAWAIMDLMTEKLERRGEAMIVDPANADLGGVVGAFMPYPYVAFPARSRWFRWRRALDALVIIPTRDHLADRAVYERALDHAREAGSKIEEWLVDATHAFDEPGLTHPKIRHDPKATAESIRRFVGFLKAR
ncbi:MAG: dienelactone hydrolase family protein [Alphaproteobacteria bacterium]|nr:dienelactone hydrolase family protein [Alphaproteobacteria bacterium]MBU2378358.1 dienelactone hydrolase family protein [Alphaproteobacteria bacterium]